MCWLPGILLNAIGAFGAGDAKFLAAAAPFVWIQDLGVLIAILLATVLGAVATHRLARLTRLRTIAPHWESWDRGKKFPMGLALAGALIMYLIFGHCLRFVNYHLCAMSLPWSRHKAEPDFPQVAHLRACV